MAAQEICRYRGYEIVPRREWSEWCVSIYPPVPDLPILPKSTLRTLAEARKDALSETKQRIDRLLSSLRIGSPSQGLSSLVLRRGHLPFVL